MSHGDPLTSPGMVCKRSSSPEPICLPETPDPLGQTSIDPYSQEPPIDVSVINLQDWMM